MKKKPNKNMSDELLGLKASAGKREKRHAPETLPLQDIERILKIHQRQVRDSAAAVDTAERAFEERPFPEEDNRLLLRQTRVS